jgi:hypothetical protein
VIEVLRAHTIRALCAGRCAVAERLLCDTRALVNQQCRMAVTEGVEPGERYAQRAE